MAKSVHGTLKALRKAVVVAVASFEPPGDSIGQIGYSTGSSTSLRRAADIVMANSPAELTVIYPLIELREDTISPLRSWTRDQTLRASATG